MNDLHHFFGSDSPLKNLLPGFQPRAGQSWMAEAVADAIRDGTQLVVEAGTGTGKTFAYLLPALQSGRKTIISTGTKALQDQLFHRDLPLIAKAVGRPVATALLKGRANYLCLQRLESATSLDGNAGFRSDLKAVNEWRHWTESGDRAELTEVAEDSTVWPAVTSTADNCLGSECPLYKKCHVVKARRAAQQADLVVVNHHLLLADLAMKEEGFEEFLPGAEAVILDEAHQIPDLAAQFFGVTLGSRELERLVNEIRVVTAAHSQPALQRQLDAVQTSVRVLRAEAPRHEGRHELSTTHEALHQPLADLRLGMSQLLNSVSQLTDSSLELEKLHEQLMQAAEKLAYLADDGSWDGLRWIEVNKRSIRLNLTPLDVADTLRAMFGTGAKAWIFTSATLALGEDFSHFIDRTGLSNAATLNFPSPYALEDRGLVWLPENLPPPSDAGHTAAMMASVVPLLDATNGGMFCLFTSHRALSAARKWFSSRKGRLGDRALLVQGDAPRDDLLRRFRDFGDAVLLGTGSFWEGVDVRGSALTVVAIDKLPFASPADPLMMARLESIRRSGGNGFTEHQLPLAALSLKQGAGRLLRDEKDFGVVVLCDPRIKSKSYGKFFLSCLAPMRVTREEREVKAFLDHHEARSDDHQAERYSA